MTTPLILFTAILAGLSAAATLWYGTDLAYRLKYTLRQRARKKKAEAEEKKDADSEKKEKRGKK